MTIWSVKKLSYFVSTIRDPFIYIYIYVGNINILYDECYLGNYKTVKDWEMSPVPS